MNNKQSNKKLNYYDIKEKTGLGIGTISRFFNGGSISEKAKLKIQEFIDKTNYEPNIVAQLMKGNDQHIYLITCSIDENANRTIIKSIVDAFKKNNINVYILISSYDCEEYKKYLEKTINRKPKTLILFTPHLDDKLTNYINSIEIPTYVFGSNKVKKPYVIVDEKKLMYNLTSSVLDDRKYKNIIYIGINKNDETTGLLRYQGFINSIEERQYNITYKEFFIDKNDNQSLSLIWNDVTKFIDKNTIIICGTHTIFKFCFYQKISFKYSYDITDVGYNSDFDNLDSYKYKAFIDFSKIGGEIIYKNILDKKLENHIIESAIIKK